MTELDETKVADAIRSALLSEPRFEPERDQIEVSFADNLATLEGEVGNVAVKKLALERAAALPEVVGIVDRLRVRAAQPMGDDEVRVHVRNALLQEPALAQCVIREIEGGKVETMREPPEPGGDITIDVADGVVTLTGDVASLARKRIAGVLAWWVPGSRDVVNGIGEVFPEGDDDDEITDVVRMMLEKDPFVDASQIRMRTRNAVVSLRGIVSTESEREMAEFDAWYVFGVDKVDNGIEVHAGA